MGVISSVYGADEFFYLLGVCLRNYGSVITTGMYQHVAATDDGADSQHMEPSSTIRPDEERSRDTGASCYRIEGRKRKQGDESAPRRGGFAPSQTAEKTPRAQRTATETNGSRYSVSKHLKVHKNEKPASDTQKEEDAHAQHLRETVRGMKVDLEENEAVPEFSDVAGLETVKLALEEFGCFFLHFPHLTRNLRQRSTTGILLFGPQGTGKTLLIRSFAKKFNLSLYDVRASNIMSKYVGESEKFIRALFDEIRNDTPAVLMLDECDGLLCNPASDAMQSHNYRLLQNELKNQWSDLIYSRDEVIIIGATNKPHDIDMDGFGRRLSLKVHVDLPDENACQQMLRTALGRVRHAIDDDDLQTLGLLCHEKQLSGYDIDCLVEAQLRKGIRSITTAAHFRRMPWQDETIIIPCDEHEPEAMAGPWSKLSGDSEELSYRPFQFGEIHESIRRIRATVDGAMRQRHQAFASQYGTDN